MKSPECLIIELKNLYANLNNPDKLGPDQIRRKQEQVDRLKKVLSTGCSNRHTYYRLSMTETFEGKIPTEPTDLELF
jgi:hypothetical protein